MNVDTLVEYFLGLIKCHLYLVPFPDLQRKFTLHGSLQSTTAVGNEPQNAVSMINVTSVKPLEKSKTPHVTHRKKGVSNIMVGIFFAFTTSKLGRCATRPTS